MEHISIEDIRVKIDEIRGGTNAYVFKNLAPNVPSWDSFISHLNTAIHTYPPSPSQMPLEQRIINGVIQRGLFYLMVDNPGIDIFPESKYLRDLLGEAVGGEVLPVSAFINFVGGERPGGAHIDNRETIYWQCIGRAVWQIYASYEDQHPTHQYTLEPGDVIYVAEGVIHQIRAEEPRAALGFQYRQNDPLFRKIGI